MNGAAWVFSQSAFAAVGPPGISVWGVFGALRLRTPQAETRAAPAYPQSQVNPHVVEMLKTV